MMSAWLFLDYDDTLGGVLVGGEVKPSHWAYDSATKKFIMLMDVEGFSPKLVGTIQEKVDHFLCTIQGFNPLDRFANSFVQTYETLAKGHAQEVSEEVKATVYGLGMEVFNYSYRALPGALEVLKRLSRFYKIAIVTKGNSEEQSKKLQDSGVYRYADRIFIPGHKNETEWSDIVRELRLDRYAIASSWAIGNSPKSDVNIPVGMGMNGILVTEYGAWSFEDEALNLEAVERHGVRAEVVEKITDILPILLTEEEI